MAIAQTQTDAASRPIMTHLTSQCACRSSLNSERSEEVSGNTDCATSPGFIVEVLRANMWQTELSADNRAVHLPGSKQDPAASLTAYRCRADISRHNPDVHHQG